MQFEAYQLRNSDPIDESIRVANLCHSSQSLPAESSLSESSWASSPLITSYYMYQFIEHQSWTRALPETDLCASPKIRSEPLNFHISPYVQIPCQHTPPPERYQDTGGKTLGKSKKPGPQKPAVLWVDLFRCFLCQKEGRSPPLRRCSQCEVAYYCSKTCQRGHWKLHKAACIAAVAAKADDARRDGWHVL